VADLSTEEIIDMITQVRAKGLCHPTKAVVYGGSHGGYLSGLLGSRYAEYFTGAIMLNPVVNLPFMHSITDIPDWVTSVCLDR
jgi:acylaminoacyl-peptidase